MNQGMQMLVPRLTPAVKAILIFSVATFILQLLLGTVGISLSHYLGFIPAKLTEFWIWQPVTYAFLHGGPLHLLFNMLILWSLGSELEGKWGAKLFTAYFFICTIGAAITYGFFAVFGIGGGPEAVVIGSSGAVYGLLLAYGILFGDRLLYFFMLFPMKARYFVMILGALELISSVFYSQNGVANTAHLGGMLTGFLFLAGYARWRQRVRTGSSRDRDAEVRRKRVSKAKHLKLVGHKRGNTDDDGDDTPPNQWN
jgi:membrane associated rhomboid family serine protease